MGLTVVEAFHGGELHGLALGYLVGRAVAGPEGQDRGGKPEHGSHPDASEGKVRMPFL